MTRKEFFTKVTTLTEDTEILEFAEYELERLNIKRVTPLQKENEKLKKEILNSLDNEVVKASDIAQKFEISTQKASALLKQLVESKEISMTEIKYNSRKVKGYCRDNG